MQKQMKYFIVLIAGMIIGVCVGAFLFPHNRAEGINGSQEKTVTITELLPDLKESFPNGQINVSNGNNIEGYTCRIRGGSRDEWLAFVAACKERGFTDVFWENNWEGEEKFGADTNDEYHKYWLETHLDDDQTIYISCSISASYRKAQQEAQSETQNETQNEKS